ncbi:hypothetical protein A6M27_10730 [Acidithiobacillus thiooxidans]|uniref:Uncharacterized protein n=2 Tax=Acidithiobacillus thiooxidans TaxID=930 RepID=A0A1C2JFW3_ACITH|nr:hypothetical protein [Acidithiobacillus thiooxidans]OCX71834.1 hypothetical protein A6P07_11235 [Acidithiobacillus thiooxidans]OCX76806.1 hypothetical protein A6O26_20705 [Acidithiobacillus thiooxidans]OCX87150.1 hypothetical protein A6M27_10730 [Acidithiobacillus thiooxidans]OFC49625.1 hypothetical protein BAE47_04690 [Acidithiobacillus thiooxidans]
MNEEDKIFKPDPAKFGDDKKLYERMSLMYERCGVTEKMIADGKKDAELSKSNPAAYKQLMESRHGKDWDKNDDADIPMRRVCTDFVKQTWETVGKSSFRFEKGGDEHEK